MYQIWLYKTTLSWCLILSGVLLKNVKTSVNKISISLTAERNSREYLIKSTREVIILCSESIISVHRSKIKEGKTKAQRAKKLLDKIRKKAGGDLYKHLITPEQEMVEAFAFLSIVEGKNIPSVESLGVRHGSYVLGLLDCIGELKRLVFDKIRSGKAKEARNIFDIMENLYLLLYPFASYDRIVKEVRRKLDVNRVLIEDTRAAVTEEIRRFELINAINKIRK